MTHRGDNINASCSRRFLAAAILLLSLLATTSLRAGGVTIITHGFNGDVSGWITAMANKLPNYPTFPGTNYSTYDVVVTYSSTTSNYLVTTSRVAGSAPSATDSGEIIVMLDWSQLAGGSATYDISTSNVAWVVTMAMQQTNMIAELGGHALVEYPLHLIGHSRGGSLITEMSRLLGTNGLWVDHLTTLDPHPLNNDGFNDFIFSVVDATAKNTYVNVLYADNYWQNLGNGTTDPDGEHVNGSYSRQLTSLRGGYTNSNTFLNDVYEYHSNVHLWYHGTIDWTVPLNYNDDGQVVGIDASMRTNWWVAYEQTGQAAGFLYSLIGRGNRLSIDHPLGVGQPAIVDGFNQWWDLGAGVSSNRTTLTSNNGTWPNLIRFDRMTSNSIALGQTVPVKLYYQWAVPASSSATINFYLDNDPNPLNGNDHLLASTSMAGTGASSVTAATFNLPLAASNAAPGLHYLYARISGGGQSRLLYAPEALTVTASAYPPTLDIAQSGGQILIGVNGQIGETIILQSSADFRAWSPIVTNMLSSNRWVYTNNPATGAKYFRAVVGP